MKRFVWIALPVMLLCFSCVERDASTTQPVPANTPDIVTEEDGITAAFYNAENPHTMQMLEAAFNDPVVTAQIESFEETGYVVAPEYSFVAQGQRDDGGEIEITTLVMENTADVSHDAVYLFCFHGISSNVVVPVKLTFSKETPGDDFEKIGEGTWLGLCETPLTKSASSIGPVAARIGWRQWLRCVGERIFAGGISCAFLCRYAPGAYLHCVTICTAGHAIYAFAQCSITQD